MAKIPRKLFSNLSALFSSGDAVKSSKENIASLIQNAILANDFETIENLIDEVEYKSPSSPYACKRILDCPLDISARRPLHLCVIYRRTEMIAQFVEKGASLNAMDSKERTPLDFAREKYQDEETDKEVRKILKLLGAK